MGGGQVRSEAGEERSNTGSRLSSALGVCVCVFVCVCACVCVCARACTRQARLMNLPAGACSANRSSLDRDQGRETEGHAGSDPSVPLPERGSSGEGAMNSAGWMWALRPAWAGRASWLGADADEVKDEGDADGGGSDDV